MSSTFENIGPVAEDHAFQREAYTVACDAMESFFFRGSDFTERLRTAFEQVYLKGAQEGFNVCRALYRKDQSNL